MNTEQPETPAVVLSTAHLERLEEAVGSYWDCAYQEGHLNRPDGDKANAILHEIRCAVQALVAAERERQRDKIDAHIGRSVMSVYGTQPECKAARDALQRLLDDEL